MATCTSEHHLPEKYEKPSSYIVAECVEKMRLCICNKLGQDVRNKFIPSVGLYNVHVGYTLSGQCDLTVYIL